MSFFVLPHPMDIDQRRELKALREGKLAGVLDKAGKKRLKELKSLKRAAKAAPAAPASSSEEKRPKRAKTSAAAAEVSLFSEEQRKEMEALEEGDECGILDQAGDARLAELRALKRAAKAAAPAAAGAAGAGATDTPMFSEEQKKEMEARPALIRWTNKYDDDGNVKERTITMTPTEMLAMARKRQRAISKTMRQIEALEAKFAVGGESHGKAPDAQQAKKLARRVVLDKEMVLLKADEARLEEEVNDMMFG